MHKRIASFLGLPKAKLHLNDWLLLSLPVAVWFSYYPVIALGSNASMNLELSLAEIALALFVLTSLPLIWHNRQALVRNKAVWLTTAFAVWNTASLAWTPNFLRGLLTVGLVWLLTLAFWGVISNKNLKKFLPAITRILIISAVAMSIFAWIQVISATWNANLLLCRGCVASGFGFGRATGFAIEPQFLGSLLLAPILVLCHIKFTRKPLFKPHIDNLLIFFLSSALFLTLSRGAIYAFALGLLVLLVVNYKQIKKILCVAGTVIAGFVVALLAQGLLATLNPNFSETFAGATTKTIHQLSLGIVDLRPTAQTTPVSNAPTYDGYIEESTDIRLSLSDMALQTWHSTPTTLLFGAGIGGAGNAMNARFPEQIGAKEIVQNEFIEVLLELGLIGALLFVTTIAGLFYVTRQHKWIWAIMIAFLVQWFFFSGYPNALHIYLVLIFLHKYSTM